MGEPFCDKSDVFLPGKGETLAQVPDYHWEVADEAIGRLHYSTRDPDTVLIRLVGLTPDQRRRLPNLKV